MNLQKKYLFGFVFLLLTACTSVAPSQPRILVDETYVIKPLEWKYWTLNNGGDFKFEVNAPDEIEVFAFVSEKDLNLLRANGEGMEYYSDCSSRNVVSFSRTCPLADKAVFAIYNENILLEKRVSIKITGFS